MTDDVDPIPPAEPAKRQWGPRRRTSFLLGTVVGLALGIAGTVTVPDLFESSPDCDRPERVVWTLTDAGGERLEVDYGADTTDGCDANIVFSERPRP